MGLKGIVNIKINSANFDDHKASLYVYMSCTDLKIILATILMTAAVVTYTIDSLKSNCDSLLSETLRMWDPGQNVHVQYMY